jgi:DNA-binding MarR family transcriptional regulator
MDDLRRLVQYLRLSAGAAQKRIGLSGAQLFVLQQLRRAPASSVEELAARTLTDQSSVSVVVTRLAARGLVARRRSPDDGRRVEILLTARGRTLLERAPRPAQEKLVAGLAKMTPAELSRVAASLRLLVKKSGIAGATPSLFFETAHG